MADRKHKIKPRALFRVFRRMRPHLWPHRRKILLGGLAAIGVTLTEVLRPWPLKVVFDGLLMPQEQPDAVIVWLQQVFESPNQLLAITALSILFIAVVSGALAYVQANIIASVGQKVVAEIRLDLYRHIQRLSHSFHDSVSSGDIISRLTGDVRMMRDLLIDAVLFFVARFLVIIATISVMLLMDWRLTLVALAVLPLLVIITREFGARIKTAARQQRRNEGKITVVMSEGLSAINVVKSFAREAFEEERFARQNNSSVEAGVQTTRLSANMDRMTQLLLAVGTSAVVWYGVLRVQSGAISPGDLIVFTTYLSGFYKPIRKMARMTTRVAKASVSGERLLEILDLQPDVIDSTDAIEAPRLSGTIRFDNVSFEYPDGSPVLHDTSLTLESGEVVAITGPSGSGKSSTAKLLMRFYDPQAGDITIDGCNIKSYTLHSLRDQISVVLQDSVLFAASVMDNIAYGRLDASQEEIYQAARLAGAHDFIRRLHNGYGTVVGERGETLSGGQRQRIAIARALLRDAPILILDEPLSGLDQRTASDLVKQLRLISRNRTTLLIAHDPLSLSIADRSLALVDGGFVPVSNGQAIEQLESQANVAN